MARLFPPKRDFHSLSLVDLLEAREAYHTHLAHLENVVATAIGLYRIRKVDPDSKSPTEKKTMDSKVKDHGPRTFANTVVKRWSWPCVLVFVDKWVKASDFRDHPDQIVPRFLYLPDGRVVPTCVVYVEKAKTATNQLPRVNFPSNLIGGGYAVLTDVQGREHVGSVGCLVTDGDQTYAVTSRHVTGSQGRDVFSMVRNERVHVGVSADQQLSKTPFEEVYPGWPGPLSVVNFDVGLIKVDDTSRWTTQVFGVCQLGDPIDLNTETITLDLIGCPVKAFGSASGQLCGEIQALFYRYKSIGGSDYIADMLIGGRSGPNALPMLTMPGDSGTLWVFDDPDIQQPKPTSTAKAKSNSATLSTDAAIPPDAPQLRPIALQWGGHVLADSASKRQFNFALATCLSTICRRLDVDIVRDWNASRPEYWGERGHYTVGAKACDLLSNIKLKKLMNANIDRISFDESTITEGDTDTIEDFYPLSDVPDTVWKMGHFKRGRENPNHFADMDQPGEGTYAGKTLFDLTTSAAKLDATVWNQFYESIEVEQRYRGCLPFRVWQLYTAMVEAVSSRNLAAFVGVAGVLAHYVGDACQPLHASNLHDGTPGNDEEKGVHSAYETKMIDRFKKDLYDGLNSTLAGRTARPDVESGQEAGYSIVKLCKKTASILSPRDIIDVYVGSNHRIAAMWEELGDRTTKVIGGGCMHLAMLWESAWAQGGGNAIASADLKAIPKAKLRALYEDQSFVKSMFLPDMINADLLT